MKSAIDLFILRERAAQFWCLLFLGSVVGFGFILWRISKELKAEPIVAVMDGDTVYFPTVSGFSEAKKLHHAQA